MTGQRNPIAAVYGGAQSVEANVAGQVGIDFPETDTFGNPIYTDYGYDHETRRTVLPTGKHKSQGGGSFGFDPHANNFPQNIIAYNNDGTQRNVAQVTAADLINAGVSKQHGFDPRHVVTPEEKKQMEVDAEAAYQATEGHQPQAAMAVPAQAAPVQYPTALVPRHVPDARYSLPMQTQPVPERVAPVVAAAQPAEPVEEVQQMDSPFTPVGGRRSLAEQMEAKHAHTLPQALPGGGQEGVMLPEELDSRPAYQDDPAQYGAYPNQVQQPVPAQAPPPSLAPQAPLVRQQVGPASVPEPAHIAQQRQPEAPRVVHVAVSGAWGTMNVSFSDVFRDGMNLVLVTDHRVLPSTYDLPAIVDGQPVPLKLELETEQGAQAINCLWAGIRFTMPDNSATFVVLLIPDGA